MKHFTITIVALLTLIATTMILSAIGILPDYLIPIILSWQALIVLAGLKVLLLTAYLPGAFLLVVGSYFFVPKIYATIGVDFPFQTAAWNAINIGLALLLVALLVLRWAKWVPNLKGVFCVPSPFFAPSKKVHCAFASVEHTIIEPIYTGIDTVVGFGQLTLDMSKTTLAEGESVLELNNAFGSICVLVPSDWSVNLVVRSAFGRAHDTRCHQPVGGDKQLTVRGSNVFGQVEIASKAVEYGTSDQGVEVLESISVKHNNRVVIISIEELLYIQADGDYVTLCTSEGNFLKERTMKYFQNVLPADKFVRIHRSCIVNLSHIGSVDNRGREVYYVVLKNGTTLRASASGYQELKQRLEL